MGAAPRVGRIAERCKCRCMWSASLARRVRRCSQPAVRGPVVSGPSIRVAVRWYVSRCSQYGITRKGIMMRYLVENRNPYLLSVVLLLCLFGALPGELPQREPPQGRRAATMYLVEERPPAARAVGTGSGSARDRRGRSRHSPRPEPAPRAVEGGAGCRHLPRRTRAAPAPVSAEVARCGPT
jgi:hypothetical protein